MRNFLEDSQRSAFSLILSEVSFSNFSELSSDEGTDSDEESSICISEDQVKDAPAKFNESVNDFGVQLPKRRDSIDNDRFLLSEGDFQRSMLGSSYFSLLPTSDSDSKKLDEGDFQKSMLGSSCFSLLSSEFDSKKLDALLDESDDDNEHQQEYHQSNECRSKLLGFECAGDDDPADKPTTASNVPKTTKTSLLEEVSSVAILADEDVSIADSAHVVDTSEGRWAEGVPQEKRNSDNSQNCRCTAGAQQEKPNSGDSQDHHTVVRDPEGGMLDRQMQALVGVRMNDLLPARTIMKTIISVLEPREEDSKLEESKPQPRIRKTPRRVSMPRAA